MFPSPALPWFELARFKRSRLTRVAIIAVLTVPLFYGGLYVWANLNPTDRLDNVQAAIVNDDEMIEVEGADGEAEPVAVGRLLAANLIGDDSKQNYDWVLTDATDAQQGLADGDYKAVLTIPENLSAAATSTDDPEKAIQGELDLKTNDAVNYVNGTVARSILQAAKEALNAQVTETYLDNIYLSFSDIKMALDEAADGAGELADGIAQLAEGAGELADGAGQLDAGANELADGNRQLADGAGQLDAGAGELADGLAQLDAQTSGLPGQTRQLADGSRQVADGVGQLNDTVQTVVAAILAGTEDVEAITDRLRQLAADCRDADPGSPVCDQIDDAADQAGGVIGGIRDQASEVGGQTGQLADGAEQVARGNAELAGGITELTDAISTARSGAAQLAGATGELASGAAEAADGAARLAEGTSELADGAHELADGADQLHAGALELRNGLTDGAEQVPDYDEDERDKLASTAATPMEDAIERANAVSSYGAGLAPYFMALALWVGAMAIYLLLRPYSQRAIASTAGGIRTALAGFAPGVGLSVLQALLLLVVIVGALGIDPARPLLLTGFALLTGIVFTAINQMFVALFGGAGRFVALVFVCLQLTSAGGTYPIETSPGFFGFLHSLMPMTYAVSGLRTSIAGGDAGVISAAVVLVAFTLGALAVTILTVHRRQSVTISRLHPVLNV
ncbi:YhgE/Pip family protein [Aeromicrobium sp. CTD01-1L150]|uniref:YhgE/Pip family protein n=1 Tax=Aeromicrobium sp. CTD01-1L150 TaxID=3341830 RepID=UPI0035C1983C